MASPNDLAGQHVDVTYANGAKRRVRLTKVKFPATADNPTAVYEFHQSS